MRLRQIITEANAVISEAPIPWKAPDFVTKMKNSGIMPSSSTRAVMSRAQELGIPMGVRDALGFLKHLTSKAWTDADFRNAVQKGWVQEPLNPRHR